MGWEEEAEEERKKLQTTRIGYLNATAGRREGPRGHCRTNDALESHAPETKLRPPGRVVPIESSAYDKQHMASVVQPCGAQSGDSQTPMAYAFFLVQLHETTLALRHAPALTNTIVPLLVRLHLVGDGSSDTPDFRPMCLPFR